VKFSLGALNDSLTNVADNESLMKEEKSKVSNYVRRLQANTDVKLNLISVTTEVEGHNLRASSAMNAAKRKLDLLIEST
jgi:23S rRNA pseudoU1915 N3-methylase RlmH